MQPLMHSDGNRAETGCQKSFMTYFIYHPISNQQPPLLYVMWAVSSQSQAIYSLPTIAVANVVVHHRNLLPKNSIADLVFYKDLRILLFFIPGAWHHELTNQPRHHAVWSETACRPIWTGMLFSWNLQPGSIIHITNTILCFQLILQLPDMSMSQS